MLNFKSLKIKQDNINDNKAIITVENLERGFAHTLGVSLRRVLLSSIPGASCFAVKINGITHETDVIDGVKENVMLIILNLKQLVIKVDENIYSEEALSELKIENWPALTINVSKPGVITAKDISCPSGFSIVNKDAYICSIENSNVDLKMQIYVRVGRGFVPFSTNAELISSNGIIATDSNYSPILQVGWNIEEQKINKTTTSNILTMTIATNGSISPQDALAYAAKILIEHLSCFTNLNANIGSSKVFSDVQTSTTAPAISINLSDLNLSVRSFNALNRQGIHTLQELSMYSNASLESIRSLGKKSLVEIRRLLKSKGIALKS